MSVDHKKLLDYVPTDHLFKDKVILVTGAGDGIGRAISLQMLKIIMTWQRYLKISSAVWTALL